MAMVVAGFTSSLRTGGERNTAVLRWGGGIG